MSCVGRYTVIFSQLTYSTFSTDMQEQALQVSAIKSEGDGCAIWGPSDMDGDEREEEREPEMEEEKAASRSTSSISPVRNPPPENHLVTFGERKDRRMHKHSHIGSKPSKCMFDIDYNTISVSSSFPFNLKPTAGIVILHFNS